MVVSTHDGQIYEDQADYQLDHPMEGSTKQPLRVTITPHMYDREDPVDTYGEQKDHKLFFVRHGETEDNEDNVIRTKNAQLTDEGRKQAEVAARQLKSEGVNAIVSSNLPRAKESAHIIAAKLGIVPQFDNQLNTWDMGKLEGQPCDATNTKLMKDAVAKTPDEPVGGGESFNEFKDRSQAGIRDAINNNQGKKLAILTHSKVEATLKAWEATGQDNPEIDPKLVNKEPDKPGSVEPFTMQANSTIMQGGDPFTKSGAGVEREGITNETGWMTEPTFEERWKGFMTDKETKELMKQAKTLSEPMPHLEYLPPSEKQAPPGWMKNQFPQYSPTMDTRSNFMKYNKEVPYIGPPTYDYPAISGASKMPFDPDKPEFYNQAISDKERYIEGEGDTLGDQLFDVFEQAARRQRETVKPGGMSLDDYSKRAGRNVRNLPGYRKKGKLTAYGEAIATSPFRTIVDPMLRGAQHLMEALQTLSNRGHEGPLTDEEIQEIAPKLFDFTTMLSSGGGRPGQVSMARPIGIPNTALLKPMPEAERKVLQDLLDKGLTYSQIGEELGMTRNAVAGRINKMRGYVRNDRTRLADEPTKTDPYSPPITGEKGDPEFERELSKWMQNQFEGGPIEGEKPPTLLKDMNPDVFETKMRKVLEEKPELRQTPFSPDNQKKVDAWVRSLSVDDYLKGLNEGFDKLPSYPKK
jgi:2,3-bisphosphoglycerate-dependent phosphoglycerate mutase